MASNAQDDIRRLQAEFETAGRDYIQLSARFMEEKRQHWAEQHVLSNAEDYLQDLYRDSEKRPDSLPRLFEEAQLPFELNAATTQVEYLQNVVALAEQRMLEAEFYMQTAWDQRDKLHARYDQARQEEQYFQEQERLRAEEDRARRAKEGSFFRRASKAYERYTHRDTRPPSPTYRDPRPPRSTTNRDTRPPSPTYRDPRPPSPKYRDTRPPSPQYPGKAPRYQPYGYVPPDPEEDVPQTPYTRQSYNLLSLQPPSEKIISQYLAQVDAALADKKHITHFPEPPAWVCGRERCTATRRDRLFDACSHNIVYLYRGKHPKFASVPWHPDKWIKARVTNEVHIAKATEIFQALNIHHNKTANPNTFTASQLRDD